MRRRAAGPTFAGIPAWDPTGEFDVVVVGIPDAATALGGARADRGPRMLRQVSTAISGNHPGDDTDAGWHDYTTGERLCTGLRWGDAGDLIVDPLDAGADRERLAALLDAVQQTCRLLVVLAGDDGVTYYIHRSAAGGLLHLDAHEDALPAIGDQPHHANFISFLELEPNLEIAQYGLRGLVSRAPNPGPRRTFLATPHEVEMWASGRPGNPIAVAIDVDVLDPSLMRSVGSPVPGGLRPEDVLAAVGALRDAGADVRRLSTAEFAPELDGLEPRVDAMLLVHLLIRLIDRLLR